jgi:hypothetical protein
MGRKFLIPISPGRMAGATVANTLGMELDGEMEARITNQAWTLKEIVGLIA